jgi:CTP:molybdopterin cytidylyltransferase MocA
MDAIGYGLMAAGMSKRMGDESKPPIALTLRQVLWIMAYLETQPKAFQGIPECRKIAAVAATNLFRWLG